MKKFKIGILIPTLGLVDHLKIHIKSYLHFNTKFNFRVYIGYSGKKSEFVKFREDFSNLISPKIKLVYTNNWNVGRTINFLAKNAQKECEYLTMHGDDDYMFIDSLQKITQIMSMLPEIRSMQGASITMDLYRKGLSTRFGNYWGRPERMEMSKAVRLLEHSKNYFVSNFSVRSSKDFVWSTSQFPYKSKFYTNYWQEIFESFSVIAIGESLFQDIPYLIRGHHSNRVSQKKEHFSRGSAFQWGRKEFKIWIKKQIKLGDNYLENQYCETIINNLINEKNKNVTLLKVKSHITKIIPNQFKFKKKFEISLFHKYLTYTRRFRVY